MKLNRRQKLLFFKVSALLSLVRWYNIFFLALAQYLAVVFILNDPKDWASTLLNPNLHLIVFASLFCIAGGYIINNFYDLEKDLINRPNKTVFEKIIRKSTTLNIYFLFNFIGAALAFLVSFNVFLYFSAYIFILWFYSHKLKKITLLGNLVASVLSIMPFFAIFIYYHLHDWQVVIYVGFLGFLIFIREIIKDLEAIKGDVIAGYPTLPVTIGIARTKWLVFLITVTSAIPAYFVYDEIGFQRINYYLVAGTLALLISLVLLAIAQKKQHYSLLNNIFRLLIIVGILSLMLLPQN